MIWLIFISILLIFLLWLLLVPVTVCLDTAANRYRVILPGIISANAVPSDGWFRIRGWIMFVPYTFNPFRQGKKRTSSPGKKPQKKKRKGRFPVSPGTAISALRSIRVKTFYLDIDTDDFMLNAWLIPVFSLLNSGNTRLTVNFAGAASVLVDVRIRLGSLLWIVLKDRYKSIINL